MKLSTRTRYGIRAMIELAQKVETSLAGSYATCYNSVGTPGTTPDSFADVALARTEMNNLGVPFDKRCWVGNPAAGAGISNDMKNVNVNRIARTAIEESRISRFAAFDVYESPSLVNHTTGVFTTGSTPTVNGANQDVTYAASKDTWTQSLITQAWANSTAALLDPTSTPPK